MPRKGSLNVENESIYNLIPKPPEVVVKPPRHKSAFPHSTPPTASTFGSSTKTQHVIANLSGDFEQAKISHNHVLSGGTFGHTKPNDNTTDNYLKARSKEPTLPPAQKFNRNADSRKPAVPSKHEKPVMGLVTTKNFVVANAIDNMLAEPQNVAKPSPDYLKKADYGKIPEYIHQIKGQITDEYEYAKQLQVEQENSGPKLRLLSEEERTELVLALKEKWEYTNKEYQRQSHNVLLDTQGKVRRKEQYEQELMNLEREIRKVDGKNIYVHLDQ